MQYIKHGTSGIRGYFNYINYGRERGWTVFYRYRSSNTVFEYKVFLQKMFQTCMIFCEEFKVPSKLLQRNALRRNKLTTFITTRIYVNQIKTRNTDTSYSISEINTYN